LRRAVGEEARIALHQAAHFYLKPARPFHRQPLAGVDGQRRCGGRLRGIGLDLQFLLALDHAQALVDVGDLGDVGATLDRRQACLECSDAGQEFLGGGIVGISGVRGQQHETDGERQECALE